MTPERRAQPWAEDRELLVDERQRVPVEPPFVEHDCGPLKGGVQECQRCGEILMDLRNAMTCDGGDPGRWAVGPLWARGNLTMAQRPDEYPIEQCQRIH